MARGIGQAEDHWGEAPVSGLVFGDCPGAGQCWGGGRKAYLDGVEEGEEAGVPWGAKQRGSDLVVGCRDWRRREEGVPILSRWAVLLWMGDWAEWEEVIVSFAVGAVATMEGGEAERPAGR